MPVLSENSPVTFRDKLPEAVDVAIIGGGIAGICTALFLTRDGVSVLVCEKGRVAGEQSSRNWGWVRQMGRDEAELPIMMDSIKLWEGLAGETDNQVGFARGGTMYLADNEEELAEFEQWLPIAEQHGLDTRALSRSELRKLLAGAADKWCGAICTASDGRAEPFQAVPSIARVAQNAGCRIIENCAVRSIDTQAGTTCAVITELGRVRANTVVCAAGAWSTTFLGNLGISLPQLVVRNTVARTGSAPEVFPGCAGVAPIRLPAPPGRWLYPGAERSPGAFSGREQLQVPVQIPARLQADPPCAAPAPGQGPGCQVVPTTQVAGG